MTNSVLATRHFCAADQKMFIEASGDCNPWHIDSVAARRTQAGAVVVHGVHVALWALEELDRAGLPIQSLSSIKVQFTKFVYLDRELSLRLVRQSDTSARAEVNGDGLSILNLTLLFGERDKPTEPRKYADLPSIEVGHFADELSLEEMEAAAGRLSPPRNAARLRSAFPRVCSSIGFERVSAMVQTSTLVGMKCPGMHSVYSAFAIQLVDPETERPGIVFRTTNVDDRYGLVTMAIAGSGLVGEVNAFVRRAPLSAPSMVELRERVAVNEFRDVSALVVGGSRGIGAATASLIAAGGGRVEVTYVHGEADARILCDEINHGGSDGSARPLRLDVRNNVAAQLASAEEPPSHVFYFATPQIYRQKGSVFSETLFQEFYRYYVSAFYELYLYLASNPHAHCVPVFYPSSDLVAERPRFLTEFAMAKAAGELLCADLNRQSPQIRVLCARLPRVVTDQTATVSRTPAADPVDVMLPWIRELVGNG